MALPLSVTSETAPLRQVVVHTPGEEMRLVSPENKLDLLFDDILFAEVARDEHQAMCELFERVVGQPEAVLEIADLLREAFAEEDARHDFVERLVRAVPKRNFEAYEAELKALSPEELHRFALTGQSPLKVSTHPLPNLLFTRDLSAVVGDHLVLSDAATVARARESVIMAVVAHHHPRFAGCRDKLIELPEYVDFEGGDLLVASDDTILIGQSERTTLGGVMEVTRQLLARTAFKHIIMVNLPQQRSCMHLDTVFTFADADTCVVYPPIIEQDRFSVFHLEASDGPDELRMRVLPNLKTALEEVLGRPFTFIPCGGDDPLIQQREQWTDGANLFALAPGLVVGYERNRRTFETMHERGWRVVDAESFLSYHADTNGAGITVSEPTAIKLTGQELSRGRGGPRCMTMPLVRT